MLPHNGIYRCIDQRKYKQVERATLQFVLSVCQFGGLCDSTKRGWWSKIPYLLKAVDDVFVFCGEGEVYEDGVQLLHTNTHAPCIFPNLSNSLQ